MKLTYFGHAAFLLEANGTEILIDPFDEQVGYPVPDVRPTAVVVSHEHFDHHHVQVAKGSPKIIRGLRDGGKEWADVRERVGPIDVTTVRSYHDPQQGAQRGKNAMFVFEAEGLRIVHLGDLGHPLTPDHVRALGRVDVLMIPVGGFFTIGPQEADGVIAQLRPRVVIPMHYKMEVTKDWSIGTLDDFLRGKRAKQVGKTATLTKAALPPEPEIWVLRP